MTDGATIGPLPQRSVEVAGRSVAYVDEGPREAFPLVLLHGGGFDHAAMTWLGTVLALRDRVRVVVPDLPGYGASAAPAEAQDLPALGRWLAVFLDAAGIGQADVAGVSMGGGMTLWLAIHRPDRVRRLIPVASYGIFQRLPFHPAARILSGAGVSGVVYRAASSSRLLVRWGLGQTYADPRRVTPRAIEDVMAVARVQARLRTFDGFLAREVQPGGVQSDLRADLHRITSPTMIIHGLSDRMIPPRHARAAAALIPGARLELLPAGHWPMRERPDLFLPLLERFLELSR